MALVNDLPHFKLSEFHYPAGVDFSAAWMLEEIRELYNKPLELTSDARTVAEELALPNHATPPESSLHVQGRAFDLKWTFTDPHDLYNFVKAIYHVCEVHGVEAEIEPRPPTSGEQPHMHLGFFRPLHEGAILL